MVNSTENVRVGDLSAVKLAHHVLSEKGQVGLLTAEGKSHVVVISPKSIWQKICELCQNVFNYILSKIGHRTVEAPDQPTRVIVPLHDPVIAKEMNGIFDFALKGGALKPNEVAKIKEAKTKLEEAMKLEDARRVNNGRKTVAEEMEKTIHWFKNLDALDKSVRSKAEELLPIGDYHRSLDFLMMTVQKDGKILFTYSPENFLSLRNRAGQVVSETERAPLKKESERLRREHAFSTLRALAEQPSDIEKVDKWISDINSNADAEKEGAINFDNLFQDTLRKNVSVLPRHVKEWLLFGGQGAMSVIMLGLTSVIDEWPGQLLYVATPNEGREVNINVTLASDESISRISIVQKMQFNTGPLGDTGVNPLVSSQFLQQTDIIIIPTNPEEKRGVTNTVQCLSSRPVDDSPEAKRLSEIIQAAFPGSSVHADLGDVQSGFAPSA